MIYKNKALDTVLVVAFVGCPNVGKSTLSNRLTRTRDALVMDFPDLTRDRKYGRVEIEGREFICIDTSGIDDTENGVETRITKQSLLTIEEAGVTLFMTDVYVGPVPVDKAIAKHLHPRERPISLVANKTDGLDPDQVVVDFYVLGLGRIYLIAASYGRGALSLLEHVLLPWMENLAPQGEVDEDVEYQAQSKVGENGKEEEAGDFDPQSLPIKLAIVGHPNIGKSTFTNRILSEERVVVCDILGTTHEGIYTPMEHDGREYVPTDTAGMHKRDKITDAVEKFPVVKMLQAIEDANVVMLVIDMCKGISDRDFSLLGFIPNSGRLLVAVVNRQDGLSQEAKEQMKETLDFRSGFIDSARVHLISTLHGSGAGNLFESIREAYDSFTRRAGTFMLMHIMVMVVEDHQSSLVCGRRMKLKYAHVGGYNPPIVVIHSNQMKDLLNPHKRYLMNYSRKSPNIIGSPTRIQFKEGENPYANKHNTLTPTQTRKCKRLMKHIKKSK